MADGCIVPYSHTKVKAAEKHCIFGNGQVRRVECQSRKKPGEIADKPGEYGERGSPCGVCRQLLYEFSPRMQVILADLEGTAHHRLTLADLLPLGFGPGNLHPTT